MNHAMHFCSRCGAQWVGAHQCVTSVGLGKITAEKIRDGEKAVREGRFATLDQIKTELKLREEVDRLRAALREIEMAVDDVDHQMSHPACELWVNPRGNCTCGIAKIRAIVERAVGGES